MEGSLTCDELTVGQSSTFALRLPLEIVNLEPQITGAYRPPLKKVLVVDG